MLHQVLSSALASLALSPPRGLNVPSYVNTCETQRVEPGVCVICVSCQMRLITENESHLSFEFFSPLISFKQEDLAQSCTKDTKDLAHVTLSEFFQRTQMDACLKNSAA